MRCIGITSNLLKPQQLLVNLGQIDPDGVIISETSVRSGHPDCSLVMRRIISPPLLFGVPVVQVSSTLPVLIEYLVIHIGVSIYIDIFFVNWAVYDAIKLLDSI